MRRGSLRGDLLSDAAASESLVRGCAGVAAVVVALCAGLWSAQVQAGPWIKAPGETYTKVGATFFTAEESFNQGLSTGLAYAGQTYNIYGEVGLPGRLQLIADLPVVVGTNSSQQGVNYVNQSLGDMRLELDWGVAEGLPVALAVEAKVPLYTPLAQQTSGQITRFPRSATNFPDPGDGNVDVTVKALAGYSLHPLPAWITGELGYRARFDGFVDGIFAVASAGYFVWPEHIALGVFSNAVINLGDDPNPDVRLTREFVYVQGYVLVTAAPLDPDLAVTFSAGSIVYARNSAAGNDFGVGVSYAFGQ